MATRRDILKTGTGGIVGLSGCLNTSRYLGDDETVGFREWLVDPRVLDSDHYWTSTTMPSAIEDYSDTIHRDDWNAFRDELIDLFEFARFYPEDLDQVILYTPHPTRVVVAEGDIDQERISDNLRREDYLPDREYEGFELYVNDNGGQAAAIDGDVIISGFTRELDPLRIVKFVIDATNGEERRYPEVDDDFEVLVDASPGGHLNSIATYDRVEETVPEHGRFRNQVGNAQATSINDEDSEATETLVFLDERDVIIREIEEWTRSADKFRLWRDIEVSTDGRIATVEGTIPTRDVLSEAP